MLEFLLADDIVRWELQPDDTWVRLRPDRHVRAQRPGRACTSGSSTASPAARASSRFAGPASSPAVRRPFTSPFTSRPGRGVTSLPLRCRRHDHVRDSKLTAGILPQLCSWRRRRKSPLAGTDSDPNRRARSRRAPNRRVGTGGQRSADRLGAGVRDPDAGCPGRSPSPARRPSSRSRPPRQRRSPRPTPTSPSPSRDRAPATASPASAPARPTSPTPPGRSAPRRSQACDDGGRRVHRAQGRPSTACR